MIVRELGKGPRERDPRTLQLVAYRAITSSLPAAPPARNWGWLRGFTPTPATRNRPSVIGFEVFDNDRRPNCTCAEFGHLDQVAGEHTASPTEVTTELVNKAHLAIAGSPTSGASMLRAARWFRNAGVLAGFAELDVDNKTRFRDHIMLAIDLFGGAPLGFNLPIAWQGTKVWDIAPRGAGGDRWDRGGWGGHALLGVGYDQTGVAAVMWGELGFITWPALLYYCDEGYAALHRRWYAAGERTPGGVLAKALVADLIKMGHVR